MNAIFENWPLMIFFFNFFFLLILANSQLRLGPNNDEVIINVSNDTLHQLISRIFQIYLIERLGYSNVTLKPIPCNNNHTETEKTYLLLEEIAQYVISIN